MLTGLVTQQDKTSNYIYPPVAAFFLSPPFFYTGFILSIYTHIESLIQLQAALYDVSLYVHVSAAANVHACRQTLCKM